MKKEWNYAEVYEIYRTPLLKLLTLANQVHAQFHEVGQIQVCKLISIKTGGCPEDCNYCPQSAHHATGVMPTSLMAYEEILTHVKEAVKEGASRICLGAAWRKVRGGKQFEEILQIIKKIRALGLEVCCTLGMLEEKYAQQLKEAGLYAYNHNLDSSEEYYPKVVTTRTYQDRLNTLDVVGREGIKACCGGILGMGETAEDRIMLLKTLANRSPAIESVPINRLVAVPGTPFAELNEITIWEYIRAIATARMIMPRAIIRLSAGREKLTLEQQALCFAAGANSIFTGEKCFMTPNHDIDEDREMFSIMGLTPRPAFLC